MKPEDAPIRLKAGVVPRSEGDSRCRLEKIAFHPALGRKNKLRQREHRVKKKMGSSRISGEIRTDLEKKAGVVTDTVGHSLDDRDPVVDPFQQAGVQRPAAPSEHALDTLFEASCEPHCRERRRSSGPRVTKVQRVRVEQLPGGRAGLAWDAPILSSLGPSSRGGCGRGLRRPSSRRRGR